MVSRFYLSVICLKTGVKITNVLFWRKRHPKAVAHRCSIKKVFQKILETSVEHLVIGIFFYQVAGLQPGPPNQSNFQREEGWRDKKVKRVVSDLPILVSFRGTTMVFREIFEIRVLDWLNLARNHLPFFKIFSNFLYFCPNFQIFCPFLTFFCLFLPFFWKIARKPLLSRIGQGCIIDASTKTLLRAINKVHTHNLPEK